MGRVMEAPKMLSPPCGQGVIRRGELLQFQDLKWGKGKREVEGSRQRGGKTYVATNDIE